MGSGDGLGITSEPKLGVEAFVAPCPVLSLPIKPDTTSDWLGITDEEFALNPLFVLVYRYQLLLALSNPRA